MAKTQEDLKYDQRLAQIQALRADGRISREQETDLTHLAEATYHLSLFQKATLSVTPRHFVGTESDRVHGTIIPKLFSYLAGAERIAEEYGGAWIKVNGRLVKKRE